MKNKNYIIKYNTKNLNMQIITMNQSYYIYIGGNKMQFDNLLLSIPNQIDNDNEQNEKGLLPQNISSKKLIDEEVNDLADILNNFLVSKLKVPVYLSMNVTDPLLLNDPMFFSFLQENILTLLIKK